MRQWLACADPGKTVPNIRKNCYALKWEQDSGHGDTMNIQGTLTKDKTMCENCTFGSYLLQVKSEELHLDGVSFKVSYT